MDRLAASTEVDSKCRIDRGPSRLRAPKSIPSWKSELGQQRECTEHVNTHALNLGLFGLINGISRIRTGEEEGVSAASRSLEFGGVA